MSRGAASHAAGDYAEYAEPDAAFLLEASGRVALAIENMQAYEAVREQLKAAASTPTGDDHLRPDPKDGGMRQWVPKPS